VIACIFPGQGSQKVGMGQALADAFPVCRLAFDEADAALGEPLSRLCFEGPEDRLTLTENQQPAILTVSIAAWRLLASRGLSPAFVAGHSLGEYSANVAAGTFAFADAVRVVRRRGRYMQEAVPVGAGAMAAILGLDEAKVAEACAQAAQGEVVSPANLNGGGQIVIAGAAGAVARAGEAAKALGARRVLPLPVSAPFHSALLAPAAERLETVLRNIRFRDLHVPLVTNVDADLLTEGTRVAETLVRQVTSPVRWEEVVLRLVKEGVTVCVEVGPGKVLSGLIRRIAPAMQVLNVEDRASLQATLGAVR
jgi:[acyl-carrier-protein] S-malonyltransferase